MSSTPRLKRALELLNLLQSGQGLSMEYLADALDCSTRTVFRDFQLLNENNIRVRFDGRLGGYTTETGARALPASLSNDQMVSLLAAAVLSPLAEIAPFSRHVAQAIATTLNKAPLEVRDRVNRMIRALVLPKPAIASAACESDIVSTIVEAITTRRQLRVQWIEKGEKTEHSTKMSPYQLGAMNDSWHVVGRSTLHRQVITLELSTITQIESVEDRYEVPQQYLRPARVDPGSKSEATPPLGSIPTPPEDS